MSTYSLEQIKPYVYFGIHKETKQFYYGYRRANKVPAFIDLGTKYFTCSKKVKELGFKNFDWSIIGEYKTWEDAYDKENELIKAHIKNPLILNEHYWDKEFGTNRFQIDPNKPHHLTKNGPKLNKIRFNNGTHHILIEHTCPYCQLTSNGPGMQTHINHCKLNPNKIEFTKTTAKYFVIIWPHKDFKHKLCGGVYIPNQYGRQEIIINLKKFCEINNLCYKSMSKVANNKQLHYKGFVCKLIDSK